jgi:replicative DNA helicase
VTQFVPREDVPLPIYSNGEALSYVQSKGWKHKTSGEELVLEICPFCGKGPFKFYLNNSSGLYSCKFGSCGEQGNFYQLQRHLGDNEPVSPLKQQTEQKPTKSWALSEIAHLEKALHESEAALAYLTGRGITAETAKAWHLGLKKDNNDVEWLLIPYIHNGEIVDVKYRSLPPAEKRFQRKGGGMSILFGQHLLDKHKGDDERVLYMVEGELDAITMWQQGFSPVLSTTTGSASFAVEWYDAIEKYNPNKVVICYDSDAAGQKGAEKHVKKFEQDNRTVLNIVLPDAKDANEYFQTHSSEDFERLVKAAATQEMPSCLSMSTVLDKLEEQLWLSTDAFDGIPSQFEDINTMVGGGYWNGQLVVLSGTSGTGKTSFLLQELLHTAKMQNPTFLMCLEMPTIMMMRKIIEKEYGVPMLKIRQEHVEQYRQNLSKVPLYLGDKGSTLEDVEQTIRAAVKRYDLKCVAFDNLNYFVRSIEHEAQEIGKVTKRMKELAVELHIPIIMVSQLRKFDDEQRAPHKGDLKGASAIDQDADSIILLWRRRNKSEVKTFGANGAGFVGNQSPYTLVRVDKARYAAGGETYLYFEGSRSTYRDLTPGEQEGMRKS